jgi:hypothetical protein
MRKKWRPAGSGEAVWDPAAKSKELRERMFISRREWKKRRNFCSSGERSSVF